MGPLIVGGQLAKTIPLAITSGARGVVIGTLGAYVIGASWFFKRLRPHVSGPHRSRARPTPSRPRSSRSWPALRSFGVGRGEHARWCRPASR